MANINKITLPDATQYNLRDKNANIYAICSTSAEISEKVVTINDFVLENNVTIHVLFTYTNTAENPTLKINNLSASIIYTGDDNIGMWDAGETVILTYDGTYWRINNYNKIEVVRL